MELLGVSVLVSPFLSDSSTFTSDECSSVVDVVVDAVAEEVSDCEDEADESPPCESSPESLPEEAPPSSELGPLFEEEESSLAEVAVSGAFS